MEVYLDNSATTRVAEPVARVMMEMMTAEYGNPSSLHRKGFLAERALEEARGRVAAVLSASPAEVFFTGSGNESNNLAILGTCRANRRLGTHVITTAVEHESVLAPVRRLAAEGFAADFVPPLPTGSVDPQRVADLVGENTLLVSAMAVNSETGAVNDIPAMARLVKQKNPCTLFHCDGVQAFCKMPLTPGAWGVDLLTVSSHKIHGPKGAGALFLAGGLKGAGNPKGIPLIPLFYGSGQERGLHPGTENVPAFCGLGVAAQEMWKRREENLAAVSALSNHLLEKCREIPGICINSPADGTPYIRNISIPSVGSEVMIHFLEEASIYVSSGSACTKGKRSHVLTAMGLPPGRIDGALRVSFSLHNTLDDVDLFLRRLRLGLATLIKQR